MAEQYYLTETDLVKLRELLRAEANRRDPLRIGRESNLSQSPDVFVALVGVGGLSAIVDDVPGNAECDIYRAVEDEENETWLLEAVQGETQTVLNLSTAAVDEDAWILVIRDKFGQWWAAERPGITSINGDTTAAANIGIGKSGTDVNLTSTLDAWSSGVAYQVGWIVSHGGAEYICTTAHTNQTPPNATYWRVITGEGNWSIDIPDASTSARGLVTTGLQNFTGRKQFHKLKIGSAALEPAGFTSANSEYGHISVPVMWHSNVYAVFGSEAYEGITTDPTHPRGGEYGVVYWLSTNGTLHFDATSGPNGPVSAPETSYNAVYLSLDPDYQRVLLRSVCSPMGGGAYVIQPRYSIQNANEGELDEGTKHDGLWATVSGLEFSGGIYTGGSLSVDLSSGVTGTLPVANGGTGATSLDAGKVLHGNGTSSIGVADDTRIVSEKLEVKIGTDRWIVGTLGSF